MNKSKKILIIDDDESSLRSAFEISNDLYFGGKLVFDFKARSQDVPFYDLLSQYQIIFIDLTLAQRSEMDGYGVLNLILSEQLFPKEKLLILTGNSQIESELEKRGLDKTIRIEQKPITFKSLKPIFESLIDK